MHHTYHLPQTEAVKWVPFIVSMMEVIILVKLMVDLGKMLKEWAPTSKAPTRVVPAAVIRFFALFMADMKAVRGNLGRTSEVSGAKAQKTFGFTFIPVKDSLIASAEAVKGS